MARIAFIGLGVMGSPMARHLAGAGHNVVIYNRTAEKAREWVKAHGGAYAGNPAAAAGGADAVITCVGNDADLEAVTLGPTAPFATMRAGRGVHRSHHRFGTARAAGWPKVGAAWASAGRAGVGRPGGARERQLSIMCGGTAEAMARAEPISLCAHRPCRGRTERQ
jgi:3-hydroxyisobutyrate dehydrogenase